MVGLASSGNSACWLTFYIGRAWAKKELRHKSLEDMHVIWWQCHLELNKLATETHERKRLEPGYGKYELEKRQDTVSTLLVAIGHSLNVVDTNGIANSSRIHRRPSARHYKNDTRRGKRQKRSSTTIKILISRSVTMEQQYSAEARATIRTRSTRWRTRSSP